MSDFTIFCDDYQEGIWFQSLNDHFKNATLEVIPSRQTDIVDYGLGHVLKYDRPDIILCDSNQVIMVLERTVEVPSGHNVGQRYGRLLAAAESRIPVVYFFPYAAFKHGGKTAGPRYVNLRLFFALRRVSDQYDTAITTINWPVDNQYEVLRSPEKDKRIKEYLKLMFEHYDLCGFDGLTEFISQSEFQEEQYLEQEYFTVNEIRDPEQYNAPPDSVEIMSITDFCNRYDISMASLKSIQRVVLYHVGMTNIRSDPYTGMAALYTNLYGGTGVAIILGFANIDTASWYRQRQTSKTYRMFKAFSDGIIFRDGFVVKRDL